MDNKQKVLICGDVSGNFRQFFARVESINKKSGPFDLLLVAGEFFSDQNNDELEAYKNGFKHVPVPTYILGPTDPNTQKYYDSIQLKDDEICSNLSCLGRRGLYTTSSGLRIAYVSGVEGPDGKQWQFTKEDVLAVRDSCLASKSSGDYRGVDILLTAQAPAGIEGQEGSLFISWLALQIKPRYHFCGLSNTYFERAPYRCRKDETTQLDLSTRFFTLASVGNSTKAKYLYAANIQPVEKMRVTDLLQKTTDETECPYMALKFNFAPKPKVEQQAQFFYDMNAGDEGGKRKHRGQDGPRKRMMAIDQDKCWFCLSSPNVEKHLVVTVGENFYLALPKGPVVEDHMMILAINHVQSSALVSEESWTELEKFKTALKKFYESKNKVVCIFERNYKTAHMMIDCIPIDKSLDWQVKLAIEDKADEYNLQFETVPKLEEPTDLPNQGPFFAVELPDDSVMITRQMKNFPLQLSREIMCAENLLNLEDKIDWRECKLTKDVETDLVKALRQDFAPFDFN